MATKSILKNININTKKAGKALIVALESATGRCSEDVQLSRTYEDAHRDKIRSILNRRERNKT